MPGLERRSVQIVRLVSGAEAAILTPSARAEIGLAKPSRSAAPAQAGLAAFVLEKGIRTVLNLRGVSPEQAWYREEVVAAKTSGAVLIDLRLSDRIELSDDQIAGLVATLRTAPRPLLIRCKAGADRSGLAVALASSFSSVHSSKGLSARTFRSLGIEEAITVRY